MRDFSAVRRLMLGGAIAALVALLPAPARAQTSDTGMARTTTTTTMDTDDDDDSGKAGLLGLLGLAGLLGLRRREPTVVHRDTVRDTTARDTMR